MNAFQSKHIRKNPKVYKKPKQKDNLFDELDILSKPQYKLDDSELGNENEYARKKLEKERVKKERLAKKRKTYERLTNEFKFDRKQLMKSAIFSLKQSKVRYKSLAPVVLDQNSKIPAYIRLFKYLARKQEEFGEDSKSRKAGWSLKPRFKAWIPDTIVYNDLEEPFWVYTNERGEVWRTNNFDDKNVIAKLTNFCSSNELVAVMKRGNEDNNEVKLLTAKELGAEIQSFSSSASKGTGALMIQRYIKSIGSNAFVVRTCWSKGRPPYCFIVNNKSSFYKFDGVMDQYKYRTNPSKFGSCTIMKTKKGKHLSDTLPYLLNLRKYIKGSLGCDLSLIVGDFIKDESGIWWLINIKRIVTEEYFNNYFLEKIAKGADAVEYYSEGETKKVFKGGQYRQKKCRYCEKEFSKKELSKKMTLKMVIQMDKHLKHRGYNYKWLDRSEYQFLDTSNLYETHRVCKTCYRLYEEITKLTEMYAEFSRMIGIPMELDKSGQLVSITTLKRPPQELLDAQQANNELAKRLMEGREVIDKHEVEFDVNAFEMQSRIPDDLSRFRLVIFIHSLEMIPIDVDKKKNFTLEIHTFDTKVKYKIDMNLLQVYKTKDMQCYKIQMNKLQIKYFFSRKRESLREYIENEKNLKIYLMKEGKKLGVADFSLNDFVTSQVPTRDFFQNFTGYYKEKIPFWAWDIRVSIGIHEDKIGEGKDIKAGGLHLKEFKGLWIPNQYYFTYETLPKKWETIINRKDVVNPLAIKEEIKESKDGGRTERTKSKVAINSELEGTMTKKDESDDDLDATMDLEADLDVDEMLQDYNRRSYKAVKF